MKRVVVFFVALIAFSCLFALNGWAIEYDLETVKDITINYTDELVTPEPKAYLKGKILCKDGWGNLWSLFSKRS